MPEIMIKSCKLILEFIMTAIEMDQANNKRILARAAGIMLYIIATEEPSTVKGLELTCASWILNVTTHYDSIREDFKKIYGDQPYFGNYRSSYDDLPRHAVYNLEHMILVYPEADKYRHLFVVVMGLMEYLAHKLADELMLGEDENTFIKAAGEDWPARCGP